MYFKMYIVSLNNINKIFKKINVQYINYLYNLLLLFLIIDYYILLLQCFICICFIFAYIAKKFY